MEVGVILEGNGMGVGVIQPGVMGVGWNKIENPLCCYPPVQCLTTCT